MRSASYNRHEHHKKAVQTHAGWAHGHVRSLDLRNGDTVEVMTGKDRGKRGVIQRVITETQRVVVNGVNFHKRHVKAQTQGNMQGGIVDFNAPVAYSNVQLVCPHCDKPTRIGHHILDDGSRLMLCRKCGETYERTTVS